MSRHDASIEREPLLRTDSTSIFAATNEHDDLDQRHDSRGPTTIWQALINFDGKLRIAAISFCFLVTGLNETDVGALFIKLEAYYGIKDATAALMFLISVTGSLTGMALLPLVLHRFGWRALVFGACTMQLLAALTIASAPPFPLLLISLYFRGIGLGSIDAGGCAWASRVPSANIVQGFMHGSFSVGSIIGPIGCVAVVKNNFEWYYYHRFMVPLLLIQLVFVTFAFRHQDGSTYRQLHGVQETSTGKKTSRSKVVYMCGLFYFFYIAVESSFTNWIPAYMKRIRHVDIATASYASSCFWTGMAIGRFALGPVTEYFGLGTSVGVYIVLATIFQATFRVVHHIGTLLGLLSIIGFFLAPMYPSAVILVGRKLSADTYVGGVVAAAAIGSIGGAGSQWFIGLVSQKLGLGNLVDVMLCTSIILFVVWILFSRIR